MTRPVLATGALVVIVAILGAALLLGRGPSANVGGPTASPSATPTVAAYRQRPLLRRRLPPARCRRLLPIGGWVPAATVNGIDAPAGTSIIFDAIGFAMSQSTGNSTPAITASAMSIGSHSVRLVSTLADTNCTKGDTGLYRLVRQRRRTDTHHQRAGGHLCHAPGGRPWHWYLDGYKDTQTDCLGDARPALRSQYIAPRLKTTDTWHPVYAAVTYRVPDGWANSSDWPNLFGLTPSSAYDALPAGRDEGSQSVLVLARATPMAPQSEPCGAPTDKADTSASWTLASEITWLRHVRGVITTVPTPITIDGHPGQWMDMRYDAAWGKACKSGPGGAVGYLMPGVGLDTTAQRQRVILLDLGSGDLAAIVISSDTTAPFAGFAAQAMPVVESFTFK